jgi:glucosyl-3-phosphoglycerate synthase
VVRAFHYRDFDLPRLIEAKRDTTISVCLPARDEEDTVGDIVELIQHELVERWSLVDEILVIDDRSIDSTAKVATEAGARVVSTEEVLPIFDDLGGKGDALWRSVFAAEGEVIVWCDADIRNFGPRFVIGLVGPLLTRTDVGFVKGYYDRPIEGRHGEGGRVTELVARPLVSLLFPHLSTIIQPLAGEYAGRRELLEQLPFATGYGVDLALLIDISARFGLESIAQVDLGTRIHRNRSLDELSPQSMAIMQTVLARAGVTLPHGPARPLVRPGSDPVPVATTDRPPLIELAAYRRRTA